MCNPVAIYAVMAIASTALSVAQSKEQSRTAKATAEYNARVDENTAQDVRAQATEAENVQRLKMARLLSKQRAQLGAANVDLTTGSALQLQEDTLTLGEADALRIRSTGDRKFDALMQSAELGTAKGEMAETQGKFDIGGSLLSGAGKIAGSGVADKWFDADSVGSPLATKSNPSGLTPGQGL